MTGLPDQPDPRLDRLFARYWDDTLTEPEAAEFNARLAADPAAREWFRTCCTQSAVAVEWAAREPAVAEPDPPVETPPVSHGRFTRRRVLFGFGAGTLFGVAAGALATRYVVRNPVASAGVRVLWVQGQVSANRGAEQPLVQGAVVPPGVPITTAGPSSATMLECEDGSTLTLSADTTVVMEGDNRFLVHCGGVSGDLRAARRDLPPLTLATRIAAVSTGWGAAVALHCAAQATEVQVQHGLVKVADKVGANLADVRVGESLTVRANGQVCKQLTPAVPDAFELDLSGSLPDGWHVGGREVAADGVPALYPDFWYDPYHSAVLSQIRSDNRWTRGMVRVYPDSVVRVQYRVDRSAHGEVVLVVRPLRTARGASGCLLWSGRFEASPAGEWRTLAVRADALLANKHSPEFGPPWVAFLLIFNTFDADIGLRVAGVRVSRPGEPVDG